MKRKGSVCIRPSQRQLLMGAPGKFPQTQQYPKAGICSSAAARSLSVLTSGRCAALVTHEGCPRAGDTGVSEPVDPGWAHPTMCRCSTAELLQEHRRIPQPHGGFLSCSPKCDTRALHPISLRPKFCQFSSKNKMDSFSNGMNELPGNQTPYSFI